MDALGAVGEPGLREALQFVRGRAEPVAADDLAAAQAIHRTVARSRLERLTAAGLLVTCFERRSGRTGPGAGRPAKLYAPAPETAAIEFPARRYEALVGLLAGALPARGRKRSLSRVGVDFAAQLLAGSKLVPSRDVRTGLERMCTAIGAVGFQSRVEEVDGTQAVISTPTCPLRPLVVRHPETAELDRGMWRGLVAAAVEGVAPDQVACETRGCLADHSSCRVVLRLAAEAGARGSAPRP